MSGDRWYWEAYCPPNRRYGGIEGPPGAYPLDMAVKADFPGQYRGGVPVIRLPYASDEVCHPTTIALHALGCLDSAGWPQRDAEGNLRERFSRDAEWLVGQVDDDSGLIRMRHGFPAYGLSEGWVSGMTQGLAASVLLRAAEITGDRDYERSARACLEPMWLAVEDGGVALDAGGAWLEEFATQEPSRVLNGCIFAVWGVLDGFRATRDAKYLERAREVGATIDRMLVEFDIGWWSLYELYPRRSRVGGSYRRLASPFYHRLHCDQLDLLAADGLLSSSAADGIRQRWRRQADGRTGPARAFVVRGFRRLLKAP